MCNTIQAIHFNQWMATKIGQNGRKNNQVIVTKGIVWRSIEKALTAVCQCFFIVKRCKFPFWKLTSCPLENLGRTCSSCRHQAVNRYLSGAFSLSWFTYSCSDIKYARDNWRPRLSIRQCLPTYAFVAVPISYLFTYDSYDTLANNTLHPVATIAAVVLY